MEALHQNEYSSWSSYIKMTKPWELSIKTKPQKPKPWELSLKTNPRRPKPWKLSFKTDLQRPKPWELSLKTNSQRPRNGGKLFPPQSIDASIHQCIYQPM